MAEAGGFRVPYGLDPTGAITGVERAARGVAYSCPQCLSPLTLRAGQIKAKHFAHRGGGSCSYESVLHHAAKRKVEEVVKAWLEDAGEAPTIILPCEGNRIGLCNSKLHRPLRRDRVDEVRLEAVVGDFRPDVVLFYQGKAVLAVEILVSHQVDEAKAGASLHRWIELGAEAVLESPRAWRPTNHSDWGKVRCEFCAGVDFKSMEQSIARMCEEAEVWANRAKNPEAAMASLYFDDSWLRQKIAAVYAREQAAAIKRWERTHREPPPIWQVGEDEEF